MSLTGSPEKDDARYDADAIQLHAYLERIRYDGALDRPTQTLLAALVERHMASIPFEAIDVLLGRGIDLAPTAIDRKLLTRARGGYCFEHASLMRRALLALGFSPEQFLARVWINKDLDDPPPAATHTALKVEDVVGRSWLVDVGFGGLLPNKPLAWRHRKVQRTAFGTFRLRETRDGTLVESEYEGRWSPLYEILDFPWYAADFKVANHYTACHPDSHFRDDLMVACTERRTRATLTGNRLKHVTFGGTRDERVLDAAGLAEALACEFGLPVVDEWRPLLDRVASDATRMADSTTHG